MPKSLFLQLKRLMNRASLFFALFASIFFVTMNYTIALLAAPYIVSDLGGSTDISFYSVTFYALGNVIGNPLGKACIGRLKPSTFFFLVLTLFSFFSLTTGLANDYALFNTSRLLQGIVGGSLFPVLSN